ncbi:MAG: hypothetical protein DMF78_08080 [Acidobacteria bacterium]|nr:MAG: hypothetical protein DMF78_08080 [Acidobacteriota bacterium]
MTCAGCAAGVKIELKRMEGVMRYDVSYEKGEAEVSYDPAKTTPEKIAASLAVKTGDRVAVKGSKKTVALLERREDVIWMGRPLTPPRCRR